MMLNKSTLSGNYVSHKTPQDIIKNAMLGLDSIAKPRQVPTIEIEKAAEKHRSASKHSAAAKYASASTSSDLLEVNSQRTAAQSDVLSSDSSFIGRPASELEHFQELEPILEKGESAYNNINAGSTPRHRPALFLNDEE